MNVADKGFIKLDNVTFYYKEKSILQNLSLSLNNNELTTLIGSNGSGKTTLGKLIIGILKPSGGKVLIDNTNISELNLGEVGQKVGYLFQNPSRQIFATSVIEELTFALKFNKVPEKIITSKTDKVIEMFNLERIVNSNTYSLSQGEKQRLALATIFLNDPKYIILDEPTTGLDQIRKDSLKSILLDNLNKGIGMLIISHDIDFVNSISDRIIQIESGRIVDDRQNC